MASQGRDANYYRALMGGDNVSEGLNTQDLPLRKKSQKQLASNPSISSTPLTSWSTTFLSLKPQPIQERVVKLFDLQHKYTKLMMQYQEETLALEKKYQALAQPLYDERKKAITGLRDRCARPPHEADGIPDFWLDAMKNEPSIAEFIAARDEPALRELKDIKLESLSNGENGFVLVFVFGENESFWNKELRKTYTYIRAADSGLAESVEDIYSSNYTYYSSLGCEIDWKDGCNLVSEREEDEDGDQVESFFSFFTSPCKPEGDDEEKTRIYEWLLQLDFDYGEVFKDKVIPYAVHWYTGEAKLYEDEDSDSEDDDEGSDDDDDDEGSEDGSDDGSDDGHSEDSNDD